MKLRLHRFIPITRVEGPGDRACLWVQGCSIRCPDCAVPWTWPSDGGYDIEVDELAERILCGPSIEGITLLGGEPFSQAGPLAELASAVRNAGLSVVTFTGFELDQINSADRAEWRLLLSVTDLLIAGPYRRDLPDFSRPWVGSSNKMFHFLTPRYRDLESRLPEFPNRIEIRLEPDGRILVNGMAPSDRIADLLCDARIVRQW